MTDLTVSDGNTVEQWSKKFFSEYIRNNRYSKFMGAGDNNIIMINEELGQKPGKSVTMSLFTRLTGAGVTGNTQLEGAEEDLLDHSHEITIDQYRNAVVVPDFENQKTVLELMNAARQANMNWAKELLRDFITREMHSINGVPYATATVAQRNAWLTDNNDRILFGKAKTNTVAGDHAASLANIDNTTGKMSSGVVSLARRMAQEADPHIRPYRTDNDDEEWFVMFCNTRSFRDAKEDSVIREANREAWTRGKDNPIFRAGDLIYDGVIIREVPEMSTVAGAGAGSIDIAPNVLCGAQAFGVAYAKRTEPIKDVRDYGDKKGVGVRKWFGVDKLQFVDKTTGSKVDHGCVTVYTAGVADA